MNQYKSFTEEYTSDYLKLNKQYNLVSILRFIAVISFLYSAYLYSKTAQTTPLLALIIAFISFVVLMKIHQKLTWNRKIKKELININTTEIDYLEKRELPFDNGIEYNNTAHAYSHDLDIFGTKSLFQHLNRTATYIGKTTLANLLLSLLPNHQIIENQQAIHELNKKITWRQHILALAKLTNDTKKTYTNLIQWATSTSPKIPTLVIALSYITPFLTLVCFVLFLFTDTPKLEYSFGLLFTFNLMILGSQLKKINYELAQSGQIDQTLKQYSLLLSEIENEKFQTEKLKELQQQLNGNSILASKQIQKLSNLFSNLDSVNNLIGSLLFNGFFLFHLHSLKALHNWKKQHAHEIKLWLAVIGEFETLNSLANFSYNNPNYTYPKLNTTFEIELDNLAHPLLNPENRVSNNIQFNTQKFIILTGSNMSGKSTFLRTLGINMVLTGIGSPICSSKANIHPLPVLVSMRLSDSLSDSES